MDAIAEDPTDDRILECAVASQSEYLVTGDNHLLRLGHFGVTKNRKAGRLSEDPRGSGAEALNSAQHAYGKRDQGDHQLQRSVHCDAGQPEGQ
jgi:hypothetical protein